MGFLPHADAPLILLLFLVSLLSSEAFDGAAANFPRDRARLTQGCVAIDLGEASWLRLESIRPDGKIDALFSGTLIAGHHRFPLAHPYLNAGWIRVRNSQGTILLGTSSPQQQSSFPASWKHRMRFIPAGVHWIGSPSTELGRFEDENLHQVQLDAFWMDTCEVEREDFSELMARPISASGCLGRGCPAMNLTWFDAILYCNARSRKEGLDSAYSYTAIELDAYGRAVNMHGWTRNHSARGYRLPTEAEWEAAYRGPTLTPWPWGSDSSQASSFAWLASNASSPSPIATRMRDPRGFHDLSGNVWEWVQDWYAAYDTVASSNPEGSKLSFYRSLRGGGWRSTPQELRSAYRNGAAPDYHADDVGLRCVRPAD